MDDLNSGVVWADQDLKSGNHFYNPEKKRGLYGFSNALKECMAYYSAALTWWRRGDKNKSLFYLGASCHLIQDVTVPQHVNIRLLKQHRKYEQWVVRMYDSHEGFKCFDGGIYLDNVRKFIEQNARVALDAHNKNKHEMDMDKKFYNITDIVLCRAQQSTAGFLEMFYNDISDLRKDFR
jgi:phospholipase C